MTTHRFRQFEVDAWVFPGDLKKAPAWVTEAGVVVEDGKAILTMPGDTTQEAETGWWLVKDTAGVVIGMPEGAFEHNYEEIPSSK